MRLHVRHLLLGLLRVCKIRLRRHIWLRLWGLVVLHLLGRWLLLRLLHHIR